jgi:hypothetical protein
MILSGTIRYQNLRQEEKGGREKNLTVNSRLLNRNGEEHRHITN